MSDGRARSELEARAIGAWRGRVIAGLFLGGFADALAACCGVAVATLLLLRVFGVAPVPSAAWVALLALPVAYGVWRAREGRPTDLECAVPLDRRLGLSGWLLTGLETSTDAWTGPVEEGLEAGRLRDALPRVRVVRLLARGLPALALLGGVLLLPPPTADAGAGNPAVLEALRHLEERLDALAVEPKLEERAPEPLRERLEDLRREAEKGKDVAWADVDAVAERLERKTEEKAAALEKARSALAQATASPSGAHDGATKSELMAAGLEAALEAGLLPTLSPELAKALEAAGATPGRQDRPGGARTRRRHARPAREGPLRDRGAEALEPGEVGPHRPPAARRAGEAAGLRPQGEPVQEGPAPVSQVPRETPGGVRHLKRHRERPR